MRKDEAREKAKEARSFQGSVRVKLPLPFLLRESPHKKRNFATRVGLHDTRAFDLLFVKLQQKFVTHSKDYSLKWLLIFN